MVTFYTSGMVSTPQDSINHTMCINWVSMPAVLVTGVPCKRKGKEEYLYSAILADTTLTNRSDTDHTVLPVSYTHLTLPTILRV